MTLLTITAYCLCLICTHSTRGITSSGRHAEVGITAACGPELRGRLIWIEGIGVRWCEDSGSGIGRGRVDVLVASHAAARQFGRQQREVLVLKGGR
jgi:3D (Asp-Asp-Asp) domain-containing protein